MISPFLANIQAVESEWPEDRKTPQPAVGYTDMAMNQAEQCQGCSNYISANGCKTVAGPIQLTGWCERYRQALP